MSAIQQVTALTQVCPTGQKVCGAVLTYPNTVNHAKLCPESFAVEGRTITRVYANARPVFADDGCDGAYVILELSPEDSTGNTYQVLGRGPEAKVQLVKGEVSVVQTGPVSLIDGTVLAGDTTPVASTSCHNLVVDDFRQFELSGMTYNLYIPKMEKRKTYPLVLFLPDASCIGPEPLLTLTQGVGAINFAEPEAQKEHPCFVLAPQVSSTRSMTNNAFEVTEDFYRVTEILHHVIEAYPVDRRRIYTTGQSMGCMASCELLAREPGLFAGALLVAGQWNPKTMAAVQTPTWIVVSQNDRGAFPGMNAVTNAMEQAGTRVERYLWDGRASQEEFERLIQQAEQDPGPIRYTVFRDSTVVPEGRPMTPGSNHGCTWELVYTIKGFREWLLSNEL